MKPASFALIALLLFPVEASAQLTGPSAVDFVKLKNALNPKTPKKKKKPVKKVRRRSSKPVVPDSIAPPVRKKAKPKPPPEEEEEYDFGDAPTETPAAEGDEEVEDVWGESNVGSGASAAPSTLQEPVDADAAPVEADFQGYVRLRGTRAFVDRHALLSGVTADMHDYFATLEGNVQPRLRLLGGQFTIAGDISVLTGTTAPHISLAASELYVQASLFDTVYILAGRRRVVWGTGLSWNPTDLVNPARDLLEPARTRAGSMMLPMVDVALSEVTLSAFVNAPMTYDQYGLPSSFSLNKPIIGSRLFTNQLGTDLSLMYFYDAAKKRHSAGTAVSSVLGDVYEVHAEGIVHVGSPDRPPMETVDACGPGVGPAPSYGGAAVVGARRDWSDRSLIAMEYLFNSGGFTPDEYRLVRSELPCLRAAAKVAALSDPARAPAMSSPVVLVRQHYLSLLAQKPHLSEDGILEHFGMSGGAIVSLSDASTILQGRLDFTIDAFAVSLIGAAFLGPGGGEMTMAPTRGLMTLELRYSY